MLRLGTPLCLLLLVQVPAVAADEPFRYPEAKHGKGELKYCNDLPVLVAAGTPEEIGEQIGVLAIKPIGKKLTELVKGVVRQRAGLAWPLVVKTCAVFFEQFPEAYRTEVEAMARGGGIDKDILIVANTITELKHLGGCSVLIVEPSRSATGQLLFGRNSDTAPVGDLPRLSLVIVRRPAKKHAFVSVTYPGLLMCGSEMNDAGLVLGMNEASGAKDGTPKVDPSGTPVAVAGRRMMEECGSVKEAEALLAKLTATTSGCLNLADTSRGVVYEITPKSQVARKAEDGFCACTNHFRSKELATARDCDRYAKLEKYRKQAKLSLKDVAKALDDVNQAEATLHSMVFEPAALRVHVAIGVGPVTKQPMKQLDCKALFKGEP